MWIDDDLYCSACTTSYRCDMHKAVDWWPDPTPPPAPRLSREQAALLADLAGEAPPEELGPKVQTADQTFSELLSLGCVEERSLAAGGRGRSITGKGRWALQVHQERLQQVVAEEQRRVSLQPVARPAAGLPGGPWPYVSAPDILQCLHVAGPLTEAHLAARLGMSRVVHAGWVYLLKMLVDSGRVIRDGENLAVAPTSQKPDLI